MCVNENVAICEAQVTMPAPSPKRQSHMLNGEGVFHAKQGTAKVNPN